MRDDLKDWIDVEFLIEKGREFQTTGLRCENARSPLRLHLYIGSFSKRVSEADRSDLDGE